MNDDNYQPGSAVEPELLLRYLIEKSEELALKGYARFPYTFKGLGVAVLKPFPELRDEFIDIMALSESPMSQRATRCRDIFSEALASPHEGSVKDSSSKEEPSFDSVLSNQFAWQARRDGDRMLERHDFRFLQVWESMTWIALHGDSANFNKFQEICTQYADPAERIERVIPLLWEVLTDRKLLKTDSPN